MRACVTGSFNPITLGHLEIIKKSREIFDEVFVVVLVNSSKNPILSLEERCELARLATSCINGVSVYFFEGLAVDFCKAHNISYIVRGVRGEEDFAYEMEMAKVNKRLGEIDTLVLFSSDEFKDISSSAISGENNHEMLEKYIPKEIIKRYLEMINSK